MKIKDIMPWRKKEKHMPAKRYSGEDDLLQNLRRDLNSLFDDFLTPYSGGRTAGGALGVWEHGFVPSADITGNSKEVAVSLEIPGVDEKDVEVTVDRNRLFVRGEKKREETSEKGNYHHYERTYGMFERSIPLPDGLETDRAKASFRKGVLTVNIPRTKEARSLRKRIEVAG